MPWRPRTRKALRRMCWANKSFRVTAKCNHGVEQIDFLINNSQLENFTSWKLFNERIFGISTFDGKLFRSANFLKSLRRWFVQFQHFFDSAWLSFRKLLQIRADAYLIICAVEWKCWFCSPKKLTAALVCKWIFNENQEPGSNFCSHTNARVKNILSYFRS